VTLDLPFPEVPSDELDAYLAKIDEQLDTLFLDAVSEALQRLPVVEAPAADAAA
jgi:hypothetical protein